MRNRCRTYRRSPARAGLLTRAALAALLAAATPVIAATPAAAGAAAAGAAVQCGPAGEAAPTDTPWPLRRLDPAGAWPMTRGEGTIVAVIDSGVAESHPALRGKVLPGADLGLPQQSGWCDEAGHGTLVAGIIAGRQLEGSPFSGVAPAARLLPVRVLQGTGRAFDRELPGRIAAAIRWAVDHDADVINLSLETVPTRELTEAVAYATERNVVLVAAAGNQAGGEQRDQPAYPAGYPQVIAVAGVDEQGKHVDTSIRGDYIDVAAPGKTIHGPAPGGGYRVEAEGGTSFAAAYVSGVAALLRSYYPELPVTEVHRRITRTADNPPEGRTVEVGYGVVNPYRAVSTVLGGRGNPPAGSIPPPRGGDDPLATARRVAIGAAGLGFLAAALLLVGRPVLRRGRQRGWRPGTARHH